MSKYDRHLAPFACRSESSRGRLFEEPESATRSLFQRDRDRVIHCTTFRRLKHKTQVFVYHVGDHYRTRLTHSIEVAQIARSICRSLSLNEDLGEALALAHDFGHTPFGHAGQEALDAAMQPFGGFDHNAQSLRLVTKLEKRYASFEGLNLTWETLEGLAKHNGPLTAGPIDPRNPPKTIPWGIREYLPLQDLEVHSFAGAEAQVAALSDDIAYNNHDVDDGLRAELFSVAEISKVPMVGEVMAEVRALYGDLDSHLLTNETVRRLINLMIVDALGETNRRLQALMPKTADDIRAAGAPVVAFSGAVDTKLQELRSFLNDNMYRHERVESMGNHGKKVVSDLFNLYIDDPGRLPDEWADRTRAAGEGKMARIVADFIAGMTDQFALDQHQLFFGEKTEIK
ncbi:MAG: deoxyguanosinetriphosphate triphosphohydrolase [Sphingomonadales bacterium]